MNVPKTIFKSYDIRGLAQGELSQELARRVGAAVVRLTGAKRLVVGRDMRETSPAFAEAVVGGAMAEGAHVVDIGLCSTPLFNFAVTHYPDHDAGVMVTASHNPVAYNGFKIVRHDGTVVGGGDGMEAVAEFVLSDAPVSDHAAGSVTSLNVEEEYLQEIFSQSAPLPDLSGFVVAVDAGNGMGSLVLRPLFEKLGCAWQGLYLDPDGRFPNHEANPLKEETLHDIRRLMETAHAHVGIALDGDGDRVVFLDETGAVIRGDHIIAMLAPDILRRYPGGKIYYDLRSTRRVAEAVTSAGGVPVMSEVGHANFKRHLVRDGGVFGGEFSCHFFFKEFGSAEASEYMIVLLLSHLARSGKKLSELVAPFRTPHSGEINFEVADREAALARVVERYGGVAKQRLDIDGVSFFFDGWWFNLRPSNTEPLVRLTLEADSAELMEQKKAEISSLVAV
ncbi:phosphomannomutase/phosphoglucomutase [Candidatus Uhrbacteria bacterium]|nr:phosphomannomutase/phosphoglucomutase [Candidatus Uhrbacteria bacterium]